MMSIKYQYYVAQSTISNIIVETCNVLWNTLMPIVLKVPTYDSWKHIAANFEMKCNFPHCLGAVDGKHVIVQVKLIIFISYLIIYKLYNFLIFHTFVYYLVKFIYRKRYTLEKIFRHHQIPVLHIIIIKTHTV